MKYCTRANVHVDRCASAWLIKRFIDPEAEFVFTDGEEPIPGAIPFDMQGVEWGHKDGMCSYETIARMHSIDDPAVLYIGRIVHGADITADADETLESPGIDLMFRAIRLVSDSDQTAFDTGGRILDGIYAAIQSDMLSRLTDEGTRK